MVVFNDVGSEWMYQVISQHDKVISYISIVCMIVVWYILSGQLNKDRIAYNQVNQANYLEIIWTIYPGLLIISIGIPSIQLLYLMDDIQYADMTIKVVGNQWYWSYSYGGTSIDSYQVSPTNPGELRQYTVTDTLLLPTFINLRQLVTSYDVIHSLAVPSLAVKVDGIPGRLNGIGQTVSRSGTYYGQCSEQCGTMHSSMPIVLQSVILPRYCTWQVTNH